MKPWSRRVLIEPKAWYGSNASRTTTKQQGRQQEIVTLRRPMPHDILLELVPAYGCVLCTQIEVNPLEDIPDGSYYTGIKRRRQALVKQ